MSDTLTRLSAWLDAQEVDDDRAPATSMISNGELVERFAEHERMKGHSANTVRRRRKTLGMLRRRFPDRHLGELSLTDLEAFLAGFAAPRTRHAFRSDLRMFYGWAVKRDLLPHDPARDLDRIKVPKSLPTPLRPADVEAVMSRGRLSMRRRIALGYYAGMRASEIAKLRWENVSHGEHPVIVVRGGKGGKDRVLSMCPPLAELMSGGPSTGFVFPGRNASGHINPVALSQSIARTFAARGYPGVRCHQLRHTFGTVMAEASNGNLVAVAAAMGHDSTQTTMGYVGWGGGTAEIIARMYQPDVEQKVGPS